MPIGIFNTIAEIKMRDDLLRSLNSEKDSTVSSQEQNSTTTKSQRSDSDQVSTECGEKESKSSQASQVSSEIPMTATEECQYTDSQQTEYGLGCSNFTYKDGRVVMYSDDETAIRNAAESFWCLHSYISQVILEFADPAVALAKIAEEAKKHHERLSQDERISITIRREVSRQIAQASDLSREAVGRDRAIGVVAASDSPYHGTSGHRQDDSDLRSVLTDVVIRLGRIEHSLSSANRQSSKTNNRSNRNTRSNNTQATRIRKAKD